MVRREWQELSICENDVLEVVNYTFTVQEVVRYRKEIPVESFAPRILPLQILFITRFWRCRLQGEKGGDFPIHQSLAEHHQQNHIGMPKKEEADEATNHDERPQSTRQQILPCLCLL